MGLSEMRQKRAWRFSWSVWESHPLPLMIMRYYGGTGYEFTGAGFFKPELDHAAPLESQCVSWEFGWGAAEVEVDLETGEVILDKYTMVDDFGTIVNPLIANGQAVGGLAHLTLEELGDAGVQRVSAGSMFARFAHAALIDSASRVLSGGPMDPLDQAASGAEVNELMEKGSA